MAPRFFIDENMLPVGRALAIVRDDVVYPGHPDIPEVTRGTADADWLPIMGQRSLVVITRDKRIRFKSVEALALRDHRVKLFVLTGSQDLTKWEKLELLVRQWSKLEKYIRDNPRGPWAASITKASVKDLRLW